MHARPPAVAAEGPPTDGDAGIHHRHGVLAERRPRAEDRVVAFEGVADDLLEPHAPLHRQAADFEASFTEHAHLPALDRDLLILQARDEGRLRALREELRARGPGHTEPCGIHLPAPGQHAVARRGGRVGGVDAEVRAVTVGVRERPTQLEGLAQLPGGRCAGRQRVVVVARHAVHAGVRVVRVAPVRPGHATFVAPGAHEARELPPVRLIADAAHRIGAAVVVVADGLARARCGAGEAVRRELLGAAAPAQAPAGAVGRAVVRARCRTTRPRTGRWRARDRLAASRAAPRRPRRPSRRSRSADRAPPRSDRGRTGAGGPHRSCRPCRSGGSRPPSPA